MAAARIAMSNIFTFNFPRRSRPGTGSSGKPNIPPQAVARSRHSTMGESGVGPGVGGGGGAAGYSLSTTGPADPMDNFHSILLCCAARLTGHRCCCRPNPRSTFVLRAQGGPQVGSMQRRPLHCYSECHLATHSTVGEK